MYKQENKSKDHTRTAISNTFTAKKNNFKQSLRFVDNRQQIQRVEDLDVSDARLLSFLRFECENELWPGKKNSEVQVSFDSSSGELTVGYNVGNGNEQPDQTKKTINDLPEKLNTSMYKKFPKLKGVWVKKVNVIKPNIVAPDQGRSVHAEQMIILDTLQKMVNDIAAGKELKHRDLNIRGKKYTCNECDSLIRKIDNEPDLRQFITIHSPTKDTFDLTKESSDHHATQHTNSQAWENPFRTGLYIDIAQAQVETRAPGLEKDMLQKFLSALNKLKNEENPG